MVKNADEMKEFDVFSLIEILSGSLPYITPITIPLSQSGTTSDPISLQASNYIRPLNEIAVTPEEGFHLNTMPV